MKKILFVVGGLVAVIGTVTYFTYNFIPKIHLISINWDNKSLVIKVRGKLVHLKYEKGLGTVVPIPFSKYMLVFESNQLNTDNVYRVSVQEGDVQVGQSAYIDFKNKTTENFAK